MQFDQEDTKYIKGCFDQGISLDQALAQLEVLKESHNFKQNLIEALKMDENFRTEVQNILEVRH